MLTINFEFRKGIFFIRLIGDLNKYTTNEGNKIMKILDENKFKYVVINTNELETIDITGIIYLVNLYHLTKNNQSSLIICDKFKIIRDLINKNIPNIDNELEVL